MGPLFIRSCARAATPCPSSKCLAPWSGRHISLALPPLEPTGDPKGVLIKHSAVVAAVANVIYYCKVGR
jgi:hypothetical protein